MSSTDFVISLFNPPFPTLLLPTLSPGSIFAVLCVCVLLLLQIISHFVEAYVNGSIYFILCFIWLLSLSMIILKFIHSVTYINNSSFFISQQYYIECVKENSIYDSRQNGKSDFIQNYQDRYRDYCSGVLQQKREAEINSKQKESRHLQPGSKQAVSGWTINMRKCQR